MNDDMKKRRLANELWKPISGYENYSISTYGRIKKQNMIMKTFEAKNGYIRVSLRNNNGQKMFTVSRLLLETFVGKAPTQKHHAAHENGIKKDNRLKNLSWKTPAENNADKEKHGTKIKGVKHPDAKLTESDVLFIRKNYKRTGWNKSNCRFLAEKFNITMANVLYILNRNSWKHI